MHVFFYFPHSSDKIVLIPAQIFWDYEAGKNSKRLGEPQPWCVTVMTVVVATEWYKEKRGIHSWKKAGGGEEDRVTHRASLQ